MIQAPPDLPVTTLATLDESMALAPGPAPQPVEGDVDGANNSLKQLVYTQVQLPLQPQPPPLQPLLPMADGSTADSGGGGGEASTEAQPPRLANASAVGTPTTITTATFAAASASAIDGAAAAAAAAELKMKLDDADRRASSLRRTLQEVEGELQVANKRLKELEAGGLGVQLADMMKKLSDAKAKVKALTSREVRLENELKESAAKVEAALKDATSHKESAGASKKKAAEAKAKLSEAEKREPTLLTLTLALTLTLTLTQNERGRRDKRREACVNSLGSPSPPYPSLCPIPLPNLCPSQLLLTYPHALLPSRCSPPPSCFLAPSVPDSPHKQDRR